MDLTTLITFFETQIPFNAHLGMKVEQLEAGSCTLRVPFRPDWVGNPWRPALHGGVMSTVIDAAGGLAVISSFEKFTIPATVDMRVDYLRPGRLEDVLCEARVIRVGNKVAVTAMRVVQGADRAHLAAEGRGVYNLLRPEKR